MIKKIEIIDDMIAEIIKKAVEKYTSDFDENNGMSILDWKNGYKNTIRSLDGSIINYIYYSDFQSLYSNFKNDIHNFEFINGKTVYTTKEETLDKIIVYLKEQSKYTDFYELETECYCINDFQ